MHEQCEKYFQNERKTPKTYHREPLRIFVDLLYMSQAAPGKGVDLVLSPFGQSLDKWKYT